MEASSSDATNLETSSSSSPSNGGASSRALQFPSLRFLQSPVSSLLEYAGILRVRPDYPYSVVHSLVPENMNTGVHVRNPSSSESVDRRDGVDGSGDSDNGTGSGDSNREVSIRIIGEQDRIGAVNNSENDRNGTGLGAEESMVDAEDDNGDVRSSSGGNNNRDTSPYQRYDIQQVARWIEQILPFSLLLLVVFIRQHLQGDSFGILINILIALSYGSYEKLLIYFSDF